MNRPKKNAGSGFSLLLAVALIGLVMAAMIPAAMGATAVELGTADTFAVLAKTAITDSLSSSNITGDVGLSPGSGSAIVGFDVCIPSRVTGTIYKVDDAGTTCATNNPTLVGAAITDMADAYSNATLAPIDFPTASAEDIGGRTLIPGAYSWTGALTMSDDVILNGQGDANPVWIFKTAGYLTIADNKRILLINGAQPKNIFWVVADYTTLGSSSVFNGNILDATAINLNNNATLHGRALAQSAITLLGANTVDVPVARVAPIATFTFTNTTGTVPLIVSFTDTSSADSGGSISSWAWDFENDGTIDSTAQNPVNTYTIAGTPTVNLTVTDSFGAIATKLDTVTVNAAPIAPVADFTFSPASGPAPLGVTFIDNSTPAGQISWAWDFGDSDSTNATLQNPVHTYASGGTYTVSLTVTDGSAATNTTTVTNAVVTQDSVEITVVNVPVSLSLIPGQTTTNTDTRFYVNSTTTWQVTAYDAGTNGFMTDDISAAHLSEPFRVQQKSDNLYVNLSTTSLSAIQIQTGTAEVSGTAYPLGIQQEVTMTDLYLPGTDVYHIVVTLVVGIT